MTASMLAHVLPKEYVYLVQSFGTLSKLAGLPVKDPQLCC